MEETDELSKLISQLEMNDYVSETGIEADMITPEEYNVSEFMEGIDSVLPVDESSLELLLQASERMPVPDLLSFIDDEPKISEDEFAILRNKIVRDMISGSKIYNTAQLSEMIRNKYPEYFSRGGNLDELYRIMYAFSNVVCTSDSDCYGTSCVDGKCSREKKCSKNEDCLSTELCYNSICVDKNYKNILMNMLFKANPNLISLGIPVMLPDGECDRDEDLMYRAFSIIKGHMQSGKTQFMISIAFRYLLCNISTVIALRNSTADIQQIQARIEKDWRIWQEEISKYVDIPKRNTPIFVSSSSKDRYFKTMTFSGEPHIVFVLSNSSQLKKIKQKMIEGKPRNVVLLVDEADQLLGQPTLDIPVNVVEFLDNYIIVLQENERRMKEMGVAETLFDIRANTVVSKPVESELNIEELVKATKGMSANQVKKIKAMQNVFLKDFRQYIQYLNKNDVRISKDIIDRYERILHMDGPDVVKILNDSSVNSLKLKDFKNSLSNADASKLLNEIKELSYSTFAVSATIFDNLFREESIQADNIIMLDPPSDYSGVDSLNYFLIPPPKSPPIRSPSVSDINIDDIDSKTNIKEYLNYFNGLPTVVINTPAVSKIMPNISLIKITLFKPPMRVIASYILNEKLLDNIIPVLWTGTELTVGVSNEYLGIPIREKFYGVKPQEILVPTNETPNYYYGYFTILKETPEKKVLQVIYDKGTNQFFFEQNIGGIQTVLTFLQTYMKDSSNYKNIAIITGVFADRGISFSSAIRPDTWHLNHMYYIPSEDATDPDLLQAVGRLCGRFNNDTIKLYLICSKETQEDITQAYQTQEALIRGYKIKSNKNLLKGLSENADISTKLIDIDIPIKRSGRRSAFKHQDIMIMEKPVVRNIKYVKNLDDMNRIYEFLDKNRLQGQWVDIDTIYYNVPFTTPIENLKNIKKIGTGKFNDINLMIGVSDDIYNVYYMIPSSVEISNLSQEPINLM
jgi:hypothetical protein